MKRIFLIFGLMVTTWSLASAQETSRCYRLTGLKNEDKVTFQIDSAKVTGEYMIKRDYDDSQIEHFPFTGSVAGKMLTVKFTGERPETLPPKQASYAWPMLLTATSEKLRVQFYGKNYVTNKYSNYFSEFESCEPTYGFLGRSPAVVRFPSGKNSTALKVTFPDMKGYRTYLIAARKGQTLSVSAEGCDIRVYLPDKTMFEYRDSRMIKRVVVINGLSISSIPQTGKYLIALQPTADARPVRNVEFTITN